MSLYTGKSSEGSGGGGNIDSVAGLTGVITVEQLKEALQLVKGDVGLEAIDNTADLAKPISTAQQEALDGKADLVEGKVPAAQLPSYVDDVLEYANAAALPGTGEAGVIYVTLDNNKTFRWSGSAYTEISASIALGETSATAYRGDRGKTAYDHSQLTHDKTMVGLGSVANVEQLPLSYLDVDITLAANSDAKVASQKAVKAYVDAKAAASFLWNIITTDTTAAVNNGYIPNSNSVMIKVSLPSIAVVGSIIEVVAFGTGLFKVALINALGYIKFGNMAVTATTGYIAATNVGDVLRLVCVEANVGWQVVSSVGNFNLVES